jgi:hypothetical protein
VVVPARRRHLGGAGAPPAIDQLPPPRYKPAAAPVHTTVLTADTVELPPQPADDASGDDD